MDAFDDRGQWWGLNLGRRLWLAACVVLWPLQLIALLLEITLGCLVLGVVFLAIAWWQHWLPPAAVADFLHSLGTRILALLKAQGLYHS